MISVEADMVNLSGHVKAIKLSILSRNKRTTKFVNNNKKRWKEEKYKNIHNGGGNSGDT